MNRTSDHPTASFPQHDSASPPTRPGVYWFQRYPKSMAIMVEILVTNGQIMVWWPPGPDELIAKLKGHWRGPVQEFGETSLP
jgi:hypothetical protein